jgi:hypothetical protein
MAPSYDNARPEVRADDARTLPARHYTDPELFRRELEAIHHDMWLHAGRTEQLAGPGRFLRPAISLGQTSRPRGCG